MFTYWAMMLSFSGMYVMYITQLGFTKKEISFTVTLYIFSEVVGQSFIGYLVDKFNNKKKILMACISVGIIVAVLMMFVKLNWQINILVLLWGFFIFGTVPLTESWCIENLKRNNEQRNFGRIRGLGSIGYGLSGVAIGFLLQSFGWKIHPWYMLVFVIANLLIINTMDGNKVNDKGTVSKTTTKDISIKEAFSEIIKIKPLMTMVIIVFTYIFAVNGIYSYLGVMISSYGGGPLAMGLTYFFDATPEIVTFFLSAKLLKKFKSKNLIIIPFLLQIIRLTLILVFNSGTAVILLGVLSGFGYGLLAASYKTYIYELAPSKYKASCMSLCESLIGLSILISVPIFGYIFAAYGINAAIKVALTIILIAFLLILRNFFIEKIRFQKANKDQ
jgi:Arabinose efflux permease